MALFRITSERALRNTAELTSPRDWSLTLGFSGPAGTAGDVTFPSRVNMYTGMSSGQNSRRNCRHMPHGEVGWGASVVTARARKPDVWPAA